MKKLIYVSCICLFYGCIFTYDPAPGKLNIRNNSDEAVYVYLKCGETNTLPLEPKLDLFHFISANMEDLNGDTIKPHFISPDYRINAYSYGVLNIGGNQKQQQLQCKEKVVTLFFIAEKTMRDYSWEEICSKQMFDKKIILTEEELENNDWVYIYTP